jgi:hypothetical protein
LTLTAAWSNPEVGARLPSEIVTGTVEVVVPEDPLAPDEPLVLAVWATGLTAVIRPLTMLASGSCTVTGSPTTASLCLVASSCTLTTRSVEVVWRIAWALAAPVVPEDEAVLAPAPPPPPPPPEADEPRAPPPVDAPPAEAPVADEERPERSAAVSALSSAISAASSCF